MFGVWSNGQLGKKKWKWDLVNLRRAQTIPGGLDEAVVRRVLSEEGGVSGCRCDKLSYITKPGGKAMLERVLVCLSVAVLSAAVSSGQQVDAPKPDTLLVLKNGAEVRGEFVELKDGQYTPRLLDGRVMSYPAAGVERMQRLTDHETAPPAPATQLASAAAPFVCRTFISEKDVDKFFYIFVQTIKAKKQWYGSSGVLYEKIAEKAREIGPDAVINFHTWHSPSGWAWATPYAEGMGVKWTEAGRKALSTLEGRCY